MSTGIRSTLSEDNYNKLQEIEEQSGMSRDEVVNSALALFFRSGKKEISDAILANAQRRVEALMGKDKK